MHSTNSFPPISPIAFNVHSHIFPVKYSAPLGDLFSAFVDRNRQAQYDNEFNISYYHDDEEAIGNDWKVIGFEIGKVITVYEDQIKNKKNVTYGTDKNI